MTHLVILQIGYNAVTLGPRISAVRGKWVLHLTISL